jgi:hypothetical protein
MQFVNRGHGGVASRPEEPLNAEMFIADWIDLDREGKLNSNLLNESLTPRKLPERLIFPFNYPTETLKVSHRRKNIGTQNQNFDIPPCRKQSKIP